MNVKPGDLAICVRSDGPNLGVLVHVDRPGITNDWIVTLLSGGVVRTPMGAMIRVSAGECVNCADAMLRPLQDGDTTDDMVRELETTR